MDLLRVMSLPFFISLLVKDLHQITSCNVGSNKLRYLVRSHIQNAVQTESDESESENFERKINKALLPLVDNVKMQLNDTIDEAFNLPLEIIELKSNLIVYFDLKIYVAFVVVIYRTFLFLLNRNLLGRVFILKFTTQIITEKKQI